MTTSCLHVIEGRVRIRVPGIKGAPRRARDLEQRLRVCPGVRSVKASPTTGNALVLYDETLVSLDGIRDEMRDWVSQHGLAASPFPGEPASGSLGGKVVASLWATATEIALKRFLLA